jgi:hypothetical protein
VKSPIGDFTVPVKETVMDRRAMIRILGGGAIAAATAPLAACSSGIPPEAVAAWRGPGDEPDLRRWVLAHAILAPHSHNLQSWLVDLRTDGEIVLRCDLNRLLPETDPLSRQIMMSQGTFLELLDLAARERGHRAEITLFPEGTFGPERLDARPVARVRLVPDTAVAKDPLFAQIFRRHTNRNAYDTSRAVPAAAWQAMAAAAAPQGITLAHVDAGAPELLAQHRRIAKDAWRIELTTPQTMFESTKVLRIGAAEIAEHRDGISLTSPFVVAMARLGLFDRSGPPAPDSMAVKGQIDDFNAKLDSTQAFLWMVTPDNGRATQVNAGRAYARVQLAATAQGVVMQPVSQAIQEFKEMAGPYQAFHRLADATAPGQTVQMWARVGYAPSAGPAPRRGLDAHIVKA